MQKTQHESSSRDAPDAASPTGAPQTHEEPSDEPGRADAPPAYREYDRSGLYPAGGGKAFRIWALLGWLAAVIVVLAGISALLNILLLD